MPASTRLTPPRRAARGVERRLAETLRHCGALAPIPVRAPTLPPVTLPHDPSRGVAHAENRSGQHPGVARIERGMYLRAIPVDAPPVFEVIDGVWRRAGYALSDTTGPDGRLLVAHDRSGYTLALHQHRGDPLLIGSSPPIGRGAGLLVGWCVGVVVGLVAALAPLGGGLSEARIVWRWVDAIHATALLRPLREAVACLGWLPVLVVPALIGLVVATWRRFGAGLLLGGVTAGLIVAGLCTTLAR